MTEVPEHLLQRSRERRAALGLGGGEAGEAAPAPDDAGGGAEVEPAAAAATPEPAAAPVEVEPAPPEPVPPYVEAALERKRIPIWAMPVLASLPIWAIFYVGTLGTPGAGDDDPLAQGAELYAANCASCHGSNGGGGVGPQLSDDEVLLTFPGEEGFAAQVAFVAEGSGPLSGEIYGDPDRPGGPKVATGGMPAFGDSLTEEEIALIVLHERSTLSTEEPNFLLTGAQSVGQSAEEAPVEAGEGEPGAPSQGSGE